MVFNYFRNATVFQLINIINTNLLYSNSIVQSNNVDDQNAQDFSFKNTRISFSLL